MRELVGRIEVLRLIVPLLSVASKAEHHDVTGLPPAAVDEWHVVVKLQAFR